MNLSCLTCAFVVPLVAGPPEVAPPPREVVARPPVRPLPMLTEFEGEVTAVDARSITVRGYYLQVYDITADKVTVVYLDGHLYPCASYKQTRTLVTLTLTDGQVRQFPRLQQKPRRFTASDTLAAGGWKEGEDGRYSYRLADMRVGDEVCLKTARSRGTGPEDVVAALSIDMRPGGRVPPAPGEPPDIRDPYHERANAMQDYFLHGIPLPDKYDPVKLELARLERLAQFQQAMIAEDAAKRVVPIAPPPRPAKPKPEP